jgi:3-methyladenine DNA glycosylase AlkD
MDSIIQKLRLELRNSANEQTKHSSQHFFKEAIVTYGVKTPIVDKIAKELFAEIKEKPIDEVFALCDTLWQSGYLEESFVACNWSYFVRKNYIPQHFARMEQWVTNYVSNWASCDTLCNHTVGDFVVMYPEYLSKLKEWAKSNNRWVRRAAAVSLIVPARKGNFLSDIFEIADILLMDKDDLVQKGYGWMLKAASQAHQMEVFNYVMSKKAVMPRTALRYAIEKMPTEIKAKAMAK